MRIDRLDRVEMDIAKIGRQIAGLPVRLAKSGGSPSTANTALAVVTDAAGTSSHGSSGISFGTVGKCYLLEDDGSVSSSDVDDKIEFKSLHRVGIPVDTIIQLTATKAITPGSTWDENKVKGQVIDFVDEAAQLVGFDADKILYTDGTDATDIQWGGAECEE